MLTQLMSAMRSGQKTKQNQQKRRFQHRPRLETLEKRELMAGNVTASVTGGDLVINGDNASNGVVISRVNDTTYDVRGTRVAGADTRLNGVANGRVRVTGVTDDLLVYLYRGDDEVNFHGRDASYPLRVPDDLYVYTYAGNDKVGLFDVRVGGDIVVNTGSGRDSLVAVTVTTGDNMVVSDAGAAYYSGDTNFVNVYGNSRIGDQLWVSMNQGNDTMKASQVTANSVYVQGREGDDGVLIDGVRTRFDIRVDPGSGSDGTTVQNSTVGNHLIVNDPTGSSQDHDRINVTNTWVGDYLYIRGNQGQESVRIDRTNADDLYVQLAQGDDWLNIKRTTARSSWMLDGGSGRDTLNRYGNSAHFGSYGFERYLYSSVL